MITDHPPRTVAAAVILRAVKDAYGAVPKSHRQDAQRFLQRENPAFALYCDALDLDPQTLLEAIKKNGRHWFDQKFPTRAKEIA